MTHYSFRPRGERLTLEADYVVVGSGAGGATAALQLAREGAEVILVEAGAWRDPQDYPESTYGGMRDLMDDWSSNVTWGRAMWPVVQARTVGGTTVINSAICVRTPHDIYDLWQREHGVGHAFKADFERYQDDLETELSVEEAPPQSRGRSNELAKLAADKLGFENHYMRRYVKGCVGSSLCMSGCGKLKKQSLNVTFVPELLRLGGTILSCAPVKRVTLNGRTATGVMGWFKHPKSRSWGAKFTVRAKKAVIVAASATHSPALLQRSRVRSRALGKYFRAHPGTGVNGIYPDHVDMNIGATQGWASVAFRDKPGYKLETLSLQPEMLMTRIKGGGSRYMERLSEYRNMAMWIHALRANSHGTVRNGLFDKPIVSYTLNRTDMLAFREAMVTLAEMHFAAGATAILPGIYGLPYKLTADQLPLLREATLDPRHYLAILSHLFGGCVMGDDPNRSVCDETGKVHGYDGLYIGDASAIPTVIGVNPQHTIMAWSRWVADNILAEHGHGELLAVAK